MPQLGNPTPGNEYGLNRLAHDARGGRIEQQIAAIDVLRKDGILRAVGKGIELLQSFLLLLG